jgi:hypothetical protein
MRVHYNAEALEFLKVAIDGRHVDVGRLPLQLSGQVLGCEVPFCGEQGSEERAPG